MADLTFEESGTVEKPREAVTQTYQAQEREVDPATMTVEGRTKGLLEDDNPWIVSARTRGKQESNARGLLESSMGIEASEKAAIDKAIEIATPDAATYSRQQEINQNAVNKARSDNAAAGNQTEMFNVDFGNQQYLREQDVYNRLKVDAAGEQSQSRLNTQQNAAALRNIGAQNAGSLAVAGINASASAASDAAAGRRQAASDVAATERQAASDAATAERQTAADAAAFERSTASEKAALERQELSETSALERSTAADNAALDRLLASEAGANTRNAASIESNEVIAAAEQLWQTNFQTDSWAHEDKVSFGNFLKDVGQQYNIQQTNISLDPNLDPIEKNQALLDNAFVFQGNVQTMADLYNIDISWTATPGVMDEGTEYVGQPDTGDPPPYHPPSDPPPYHPPSDPPPPYPPYPPAPGKEIP